MAKGPAVIARSDIAGMVLAGGQGARMGGLDKGLQSFQGVPLAAHALERLRPQVGAGKLSINANRNLDAYAGFGVPVVADTLADHPGPLAGMLTGLAHCDAPWLLTVPCDTPRFPTDLAQRLAEAATQARAAIAIAAAPETSGETVPALRFHPVACLLSVALREDLRQYLAGGGRRVMDWIARHPFATAAFVRPGDDPEAFRNANTLAELRLLETLTP